MARDFGSPAYQRIATAWAEKIDKGVYPDGYQLPTRPELEAEHDVSRQVVRDALTLLQTEGYVRSEPSKGTFVNRPWRIDLPMSFFEGDDRDQDVFLSLVRDRGHNPEQRITVETVLGSDPDLPTGLDVAPDRQVVVRRRLRSVDGVPYAISDSFYPMEVVRGSEITSPADITRGARHVLAELGYAMHRHADLVESRRPHASEVRKLNIAPGLPVIAHTRVSRAENGTPVRLLASVLPSDRWRLTYEVG